MDTQMDQLKGEIDQLKEEKRAFEVECNRLKEENEALRLHLLFVVDRTRHMIPRLKSAQDEIATLEADKELLVHSIRQVQPLLQSARE